MKTYNFGTYWITTDEELTGYIECFDITPEQKAIIDAGANIEVVDGILELESAPLPVEEITTPTE